MIVDTIANQKKLQAAINNAAGYVVKQHSDCTTSKGHYQCFKPGTTSSYEVAIVTDELGFTIISCSCPAGETDKVCKHSALVQQEHERYVSVAKDYFDLFGCQYPLNLMEVA